MRQSSNLYFCRETIKEIIFSQRRQSSNLYFLQRVRQAINLFTKVTVKQFFSIMRQQGNPVFSEETVKQFYIFSKETVRQFITCLGWGWPYASNAPPRGHIWTQIVIKVSKKQLSFLNLHLTWLWNWMIKLFCYLIIEVKAQYKCIMYCTVQYVQMYYWTILSFT